MHIQVNVADTITVVHSCPVATPTVVRQHHKTPNKSVAPADIEPIPTMTPDSIVGDLLFLLLFLVVVVFALVIKLVVKLGVLEVVDGHGGGWRSSIDLEALEIFRPQCFSWLQ
eukprot:gnl/TRDRNA2_/TRDRNA2_128535_c2_seq1.p2 gnl/TRDRNA2_/TRDRNA2_128535_c2~~gnl/TRDRNA2_/TRDRNA2_128535_c2_seq1.p2  ORF type:complete len:113 (-),score=17.03 gnl/TRDRNA2_/TRDRNA2_128535_c2_seq1:91-429(-)